MNKHGVIAIWCARLVWALLPVTIGDALGDALDGWSTGSARTAAVLCWAAWAAGEVALLAPRPWGLTYLRITAPAVTAIAIVAAFSAGAAPAALAVVGAIAATTLALSARVAQATGNALAYGDETRYPLRIPTPLLVTLVPLAIVVALASVAAGPLLLADERVPAGAVACVIGVPAVVLAVRSLHSLSKRWVVLVPAGLVVVDPLALTEPTLVRREQIASLSRAPRRQIATTTLDLTLGTTFTPTLLETREPVNFTRRRGRAGAEMVATMSVLVVPVLVRELLATAAARRIPVQPAAIPPPSTMSPS
ncbi:MAG TPA: hypothetical protein VFX21_14915 [Acidimicrobiia bacterium]|nr:hypothetical protein [Acidimicrobiia bacterium]